MFMDDNAMPHRARIVQHFLQQEAVQTIPWPAMSPDTNPIEHVRDFIGKNVQVQLTVKGKTTPDSYTLTLKSSCAQNVVGLK
jgi:hypothetical protein